LCRPIRRAYFKIKPTTAFRPFFDVAAASTNELALFSVNQIAFFLAYLLAIAYLLGD
jgi:hypothetical protein